MLIAESILCAQLFSASALEPVPQGPLPTSPDDCFNPEKWPAQLAFRPFAPLGSGQRKQPATARRGKEWKDSPSAVAETGLYMLRDNDVLYVLAVLRNENRAEAEKTFQKDQSKIPYQLNGIELVFGTDEAVTQLAFDYAGRLYHNTTEPIYHRAKFHPDRTALFCVIPLSVIPRLSYAEDVTLFNAYRKHKTGVSSAFPNLKGAFLNMTQTWMLFLETPEKIVRAKASRLYEKITESRKNNSIDSAAAKALKEKIASGIREVSGLKAEGVAFLEGMKKLDGIDNEIVAAQLKSMRRKYGTDSARLPSATGAFAIPGVWVPKKFHGRDYTHYFTVLGLKSVEMLDDAVFFKLPLFRDAILGIRWGQPPLKEFLPPDGELYRLLQKYRFNFFVHTADCGGVIPENRKHKERFNAFFDKKFMERFYSLYQDRFFGFWEHEAFAFAIDQFRVYLQKYKIPFPRTREEAMECFKKCYNMKSAARPENGVIPFRNLANMSVYTAKYSSNCAAEKLNHLVQSLGDPLSGNENGEVMRPFSSNVAFARGSARQFETPWRNYQTYYNRTGLNEPGPYARFFSESKPWSFDDLVEPLLTPRCREHRGIFLSGLETGHTLDRQKYTFFYPFLTGAGVWGSENDLYEIACKYDLKTIDRIDPLILNLRDQKMHISPHIRLCSDFYSNVVLKRDRGVSYTPFALILDRSHGYLPALGGGLVWGFFSPTEMKKTMWAIDQQLFRRLPRNSSYATCPYGDVFDVLTNDVRPEILKPYKILYPVGDVTLDAKFVSTVKEHVKNGGTVVLNAALLKKYPNAFDEKFTGCRITGESGSSRTTYSKATGEMILEKMPYSYTVVKPDGAKVTAITTDFRQAPAILVNQYGRGRVILTTPEHMKLPGSMKEMLKLFDHLAGILACETAPLTVRTDMQYALNRNRNGWIVYLQNNFGIPPNRAIFYGRMPSTDTSKKAKAVITVPAETGKIAKVIDWWTSGEVPFRSTAKNGTFEISLPGGDCCALEIVLK